MNNTETDAVVLLWRDRGHEDFCFKVARCPNLPPMGIAQSMLLYVLIQTLPALSPRVIVLMTSMSFAHTPATKTFKSKISET